MEGNVEISLLIDQVELKESLERAEQRSRECKMAITEMEAADLEKEKYREEAKGGRVLAVKGEERVRRTSRDLRQEIISLGGMQNLIELRKKRKERKKVPAPELEKEDEEIRSRECKMAITEMEAADLEKEKYREEAKGGRVLAVKGEERVRRTSRDLRQEIISLGGMQNLIELRKKRKERKKVPAPELEKEDEEIPGPVEVPVFLLAAVRGKIRTVEKFLADGGDADACDEFKRTALHRAALEGHTEILIKLLDAGATVDFKDRLDCTSVHWACRGGRLEVLKLLRDKGASVNVHDKLLSTPLHVATRTGHVECVEYLIACGIDINTRDREGDSALHDAVRLSRYKITKLLILQEADLRTKNNEGKTPTDLVQQWQLETKGAFAHAN